MRRSTVILVILAGLVLAGCGSFWEAQGDASRTSAEARLRQAEAERQNAQAAIIDAEARGAMAESQSRALTTAMDANVDITKQAISLADNGEYVWLFAALAFGVLGFAGWTIWMMARRPAAAPAAAPPAPRQIAVIEAAGRRFELEQGEGESHAAFLFRVQVLAERAAEREQKLLTGGRR